MRIKHYLIPTEENDYRPWITSPSALLTFCLIIWCIRLLVPANFSSAAGGIDATDLMAKINNERTNRFISALTTNTKLIVAATEKSNDMLTKSYFAHIDPDGNYVWPKIVAAGYGNYLTLGENLAIDFTTSSGVIEGWMNSPTHRANVLNEKFQDQGLAALFGTFSNHETIAITSLFGALAKKTTQNQTITPTPVPTPAPTPVPPPPPAIKAPIAKVNPPPSKPPPSPTPAPTPIIPTPEEKSEPEPVIGQATIPVSEEASFISTLRIILGIFALIYVFFLILDSVIIYRAKIKRASIHSSPHTLLFALIALGNILASLL